MQGLAMTHAILLTTAEDARALFARLQAQAGAQGVHAAPAAARAHHLLRARVQWLRVGGLVRRGGSSGMKPRCRHWEQLATTREKIHREPSECFRQMYCGPVLFHHDGLPGPCKPFA
jgi:hypothetical protein